MMGKVMAAIQNGWKLLNDGIEKLDKLNLWFMGLFLLLIAFLPFAVMGQGSVFEIHDQLDETILAYVLNARYLGMDIEIFPEMMGGIPAGSLQPAALLFVCLYKVFPAFTAFVLQYFLVCASGFFGMYFCTRELTGSSILAVMVAGIFSMLPVYPVYGLSMMGVPLLFYAFLSLYQKKRIILACLIIAFFGLTTHLALIGYVVLSLLVLSILVMTGCRKHNRYFTLGTVELLFIYVITNRQLLFNLFIQSGAFISHREEWVSYGSPLWETITDVWINSSQHVPSFHKYLILPSVGLLIFAGIRLVRNKKEAERKFLFYFACGVFALIIMIAIFFGICRSTPVADWKNSMSGFFRHFQMERYYWLYPSLWYLLIGVLLGIVWRDKSPWMRPAVKLLAAILLLLPTVQLVKVESIFYRNVNQYNNGSQITGDITWEDWFAEDLMSQIELSIGREMCTYRIACLGISPAVPLMHGFYTIDGYSNNYSLDYKHEFRKIISQELDKNEWIKLYFDNWASRCYLFSGEIGAYWRVSKASNVVFQELSLNIKQMKNLGCEYLLSGGQIANAEEMGLNNIGFFESESSYWGIWLYQLPENV